MKSVLMIFIVLIFLSGRILSGEANLQEGGQADRFFDILGGGQIPEIKMYIRPENVSALEAAIPKDFPIKAANCVRTRFKWTAIERILLDGKELRGSYQIKNTGLCDKHWSTPAKSFHLKAENGMKFYGLGKIRLTALNTDPFLFDLSAGQLYRESGGMATRVGLAHVYINDKYEGIREVIEGLDSDFPRNYGLEKGAIYKERTIAHIGDADYLENLKAIWEKKSLKKQDWSDLRDLNDVVYQSVLMKKDYYKSQIDVDSYINYIAVINLLGSNANNYHNIPIYRPQSRKKFIPIGNDFSGSWQSSFSGIFEGIHIPFMSMNWVNDLIVSEETLRERIHQRIVELIPELEKTLNNYRELMGILRPHIKKSIEMGHVEGIASIEEYERKNTTLSFLGKRLSYFKENYLGPLARADRYWREKDEFNLLLEGLGRYRLTFEVPRSHCLGKGKASLKVRYHLSDWNTLQLCSKGGNEIIVERNDINFPDIKKKFHMKRNGVGPILIQAKKNGNYQIKDLKIISMQTKQEVKIHSNIPFVLGSGGRKGIEVHTKLDKVSGEELSTKDGWNFFNANPDRVRFGFEGSLLKVDPVLDQEVDLSHKYHLTGGDFGPLLCWNIQGRKNCFEFTKKILIERGHYPRNYFKTPSRKKRGSETSITANDIKSCQKFVFSAKTWSIDGPLVFDRGCEVIFESGAVLEHSNDSYIVIKGPIRFPEKGPSVVFRPHQDAESDSWGGLVLYKIDSDILVQNAEFEKTSEFYWENRRFSGALNLIYPEKYRIKNVLFNRSYGDDAVNVVGGEGVIEGNQFKNSVDAIDIDFGKADIIANLIEDVSNDGIDSSGAKLLVENNLIVRAGDKCLSIGEKSAVKARSNVMGHCNVGIAVKDGSSATLEQGLISKSFLALSVYNKETRSGRKEGGNIIEGNSFLVENQMNFNVEGEKVSRIGSFKEIDKDMYSERIRREVEDAVKSRCPFCLR